LIDNTIKYSYTNTKIEIALKLNTLTIKNYSEGINKKDLPFVFEQYYKADNNKKQEGYGLGLSIVKTIMDICDFEIDIKSKINKYTTVIISF